MDPLSISVACITLVEALYKTANGIKNVVKTTKDGEQSVRALEALNRGCAGVLENLSEALRSSALNVRGNEQLWTTVYNAVRSCEETIGALEAKLKPIRGRFGGLRQLLRSYRLLIQKEDIDRIIGEMRTHSINLQLALQTVHVIITASIPGAITAEQGHRFDRLEQMIAALQLHRNLPNHRLTIAEQSSEVIRESEGPVFHAITLDQNTIGLLSTATSVIGDSSNRSRKTRTIFSAATRDTADQAVFNTFLPGAEETSAAPLEFGALLSGKQTNNITEWIQQAPSAANDDQSPASPIVEQDEDEQDDTDYQVALWIFDKGKSLFLASKFNDALDYLGRSLAYAGALRSQEREDILIDIRMLRAVCYSWLGKFEEAESSFFVVITTLSIAPSLPGSSHGYCTAVYELAALQLRSGKLDAAMTHCRQALKITRKTDAIDQRNRNYLIRLLALIHWAKGEKIDALSYSTTLPDDIKIEETQFDNVLESLSETPEREPSLIWKFIEPDIKMPIAFVGIQNQGATGYVNVTIQTLYFIKAIPQAIFRTRATKGGMIWALQRLFYSLRTSPVSVSTKELTESFGWGPKELNKPQDVDDMFTFLIERLRNESVNQLFRFQQVRRITCTEVEWNDFREENAFYLNLDITESLKQSFDEYTKSVLLDDETKYYTEKFGLQAAKRAIVLKNLPDVLRINIRRERYSITLGAMHKQQGCFAYPEEFDAAPYLKATPAPGTEPWIYTLMTVIVHFGNIDGGIYFSITRPSLDGPFYLFNDEKIKQVSKHDAFDRNFGEPIDESNGPSDGAGWKGRHKSSRTAHILIYLRKSRAEQLLQDWPLEDVQELIN